MALTKEKKEQVVADVGKLLAGSKLTVIAKYQGTTVAAMQQLRQGATSEGTHLQVVKNRLFKRALRSNDTLKDVDTSELRGQLIYAFSDEDEVAPARVLAQFAKTNPQIEFVAAITAEGQLLEATAVKDLAALPTKTALRAQLAGTIGAPISGFVNVVAGNIRGLVNVLNARGKTIG